MNRRCFVLFSSMLLFGAMLVTTAYGQSANGSMTLAERMAALRRGWSTDKAEEQGTTGTQSEEEASGAGQSAGRSLLPNWLNRRDEQPPARPAKRSPAASSSTPRTAPQSRTAAQPRTAPQPRAGSAQSAPSTPNSVALPGLGGSPLPQGKWTPAHNSAAARGDVAREISSDYPVIRDVTREKSTTQQQSSTTRKSPTVGTSTRHSPGLRPTPHLDPEQLRRELSGSFSSPGNGPVARTARANDGAQQENPPADAPLVLPPVEPAAPAEVNSQADSLKSEQAEPPTSTIEDQPQSSTAIDLPQSAAEAFGATPETKAPAPLGASGFTRSPQSTSTTTTDRRREAFGEALQVASGGDPTVLISNQAPIIAADIRGPKQILVGREAVYRVRLQNQGAAAAEGVVASIRIPSWADVIDTAATQGTVQPSQSAATPTQLEWQLTRLDGRATETLDVRLVPRASRPLELGISWTVAPVGSRAIVEVQEPKLKIDVDGPNEVLFAKPQVFRLTISNPGTGLAENVKIELVPPGAQEAATNHAVGDLQPGDSKTVEIELTAREAGKLQVKAIASAEGGLTSDFSKEVFCRKPELNLDWRGPATKYAGTPTTYFFRVRNPGTAPAEDVKVQVILPEAAEFTSASEGQTFDSQRRQVIWQVGTLEPGDDNYMELKCVVKKPGANQFQVTATTSSGDLSDKATAETNVIALADLKLEVSDPSGPVAVGSPVVYEIHVANRGANTAKDVNIVALFSEGIEPDQAEGAMYTVADGRVSFRPIEELPAGRDITLRIHAHALQPGTHVFRAEVLCQDAEIKLAAEETTRFYADEALPEADEAQQQATSRSGFEAAVR
ncbi:MAG: CARDB domain-containing protein [Pirellulales bacterium]